MLRTFNAVVHEDKIQWREDDAKYVPSGEPARVLVTFLDDLPERTPSRDRAQRRAAAMQILSSMQTASGTVGSAAILRQPREHRELKR